VATQQIVLGPGGHTGWHSHPGPVLARSSRAPLKPIMEDRLRHFPTIPTTGRAAPSTQF
jgi:hypothetical protein